jgi:hypothetical protein
MKGCELAVVREIELALFTAWQTGRFASYSGTRLPPLDKVMRGLRRSFGASGEPRRQSREEMLAALRAIKATMGG